MEIVVPDEYKYLYETNAQRPVVKVPHPILRQVATEVVEVSRKTDKLIDEMIRMMRLSHGVGLAAPQAGVGKRIIVIAPMEMKPMAMINPVITEADGEMTGQEGCLSLPGLYGDVVRAARILVEAHDRKGKPIAYEMDGMAARVVQHEVDHLDGILFTDKVIAETLHWEHPDGRDVEPAE